MLPIRTDWDVMCCQFFFFVPRALPSENYTIHVSPSPPLPWQSAVATLCEHYTTHGCTLSLWLLGLKINSRLSVTTAIHTLEYPLWGVKSALQAHTCRFVNKGPGVRALQRVACVWLFQCACMSLNYCVDYSFLMKSFPTLQVIGSDCWEVRIRKRQRLKCRDSFLRRKKRAFREPYLKVIKWASHTERLGTSKRSSARGTLRKAHSDAFKSSTLWETERNTLATQTRPTFLQCRSPYDTMCIATH